MGLLVLENYPWHLFVQSNQDAFFQELPDQDQERLTQNMLDLFYERPSRWSGMTQVMFLTQRFKALKAAEQMNTWCLFDRSIYGDEIFAYNLYKRNEMTKEEFSIYQLLLETFIQETTTPIFSSI